MEILEVLVQSGADIRSKNKQGQTPLQLAQDYHSQNSVVDFLQLTENNFELSNSTPGIKLIFTFLSSNLSITSKELIINIYFVI